jgi:hypothetical protein
MWHEHPPLVLAPSQAKQLYRDHCVASRARKRSGALFKRRADRPADLNRGSPPLRCPGL